MDDEFDWLSLSRVILYVPDDLLCKLRQLRDEHLKLLDKPYDIPRLEDNDLIIKILVDWIDLMKNHLANLQAEYDLETQQFDEEVREAQLNGGRTGWLYDDDGNEYYTTVDGVRHYTRDEG